MGGGSPEQRQGRHSTWRAGCRVSVSATTKGERVAGCVTHELWWLAGRHLFNGEAPRGAERRRGNGGQWGLIVVGGGGEQLVSWRRDGAAQTTTKTGVAWEGGEMIKFYR